MANYKILKTPKFNNSLIGPTPNNWEHNLERNKEELKFEEKIFDLTKDVGKPFGWTTQQRGKLVHDIIADTNKVDSQSQIGSNCDIELILHTEDGFALNKPNYIALACIRNEEKAPTIISDIDDIDIYQIPFSRTLFEETINILPDDTHLDSNHLYNGSGRCNIMKPIINKKITTLKYIENQLQLTYDPSYTKTILNPRLQLAYTKLTELLEAHSKEIVMEPGDVLIINNLKIVHGRKKYNSLDTGQKRWLKRILLKI